MLEMSRSGGGGGVKVSELEAEKEDYYEAEHPTTWFLGSFHKKRDLLEKRIRI